MPFNQFTPRNFTNDAVQMYAPGVSGVYGISNAREWIYIGETDNIQSSLLDHLHEINTKLMKREPTGFVFEVCDQARRASRQDRLVTEYGPACNRLAPQQS
jgi:predicted GIY-YIG superfamily endonuclease